MYRVSPVRVVKPLQRLVRRVPPQTSYRAYSASVHNPDFLGRVAHAFFTPSKVAKPVTKEPAVVETKDLPKDDEPKPKKAVVADNTRKVPAAGAGSSLNRAKMEELAQLAELNKQLHNSGMQSESQSSLISKVSKAYPFKFGFESVSPDKFAEVLEVASSVSMQMGLKKLLKDVVRDLGVGPDEIHAMLVDPFTIALGEDTHLVPVARFDEEEGKRAIIDSMELWPSEYYVDKGRYAQVKQPDAAATEALSCVFEKNDILALVEGDDLEQKKYPFLGHGYIGSEDKKLPFKAIIYCNERGQLEARGELDMINKLKAGLALRQMQTKAKVGVILKAFESCLNKRRLSSSIEKRVSKIEEFLEGKHSNAPLPGSARAEVKMYYKSCSRIVADSKIPKALAALSASSKNAIEGETATVFKDSGRVEVIDSKPLAVTR